jgi:outer membrane lipoprotein-sorting protein
MLKKAMKPEDRRRNRLRHQAMHAILILLFAGLAAPFPAADPLDAVFARIDAAAKTFKGVTADITDTEHHALVPDDDDISTGTIKLLRVNATLTRLLATLKGPGGNQTIAVNGPDVRVYTPATNTLNQFDFASRQGMVNQFLLLGFGATSAELKSAYTITWVGEEKISAAPTSHLRLIPKSADSLRTLKQADLWYGANGLVAQQKFLQVSGDYRLVTYSNMKLGAMPEKDLDLKPKGATVQKH